jgi:hypothetical protein
VRHRLRSAICIAVVALAGIVVAGTGCAGQGEGDRCTCIGCPSGNASTDGTQECASGLTCYPYSNFPTASGLFDRCCITGLPQTNVQACVTGGTLIGGGNPTSGADASFDANATDARSTSDGTKEDVKTADVEKADVVNDGEIDSAKDGASEASD